MRARTDRDYEPLHAFRGNTEPLGLHVQKAVSGHARRRGLLDHGSIGRGHGLLIPWAPIIHMFGMSFPIDIVFLSRNGTVRAVKPSVRPGPRLRVCFRARDALELAAGEASRLGITPGDRLQFLAPTDAL